MSALNIFYVLCIIRLSISLPINHESNSALDVIVDSSPNSDEISVSVVDSTYTNELLRKIDNYAPNTENIHQNYTNNITDVVQTRFSVYDKKSVTRTNQIRPGMKAQTYAVEITPNYDDQSFKGRLVVQVSITDSSTTEDDIKFYVRDLKIDSVTYALVSGVVFTPVQNFNVNDDDGTLEIQTGVRGSLYTFVIEYRGSLSVAGQALYLGSFGSTNYLAMNLHPTNARRVFPCLDEPDEKAIISFTYINHGYDSIVSNSLPEENGMDQFRAIEGPPHLWSMAAHNFNNINSPTNRVILFGRSSLNQIETSYASIVINYCFTHLNEWTDKPYFEIQGNQNDQLSILALPDVSVDWYGLSMVGVWEPYLAMGNTGSIKQRTIGSVKVAEALAKQWFGYVISPENWRFEWVVSGLAEYAAWEALRMFQSNSDRDDVTLLDINTLFVTEVIQESLYRDAYTNALVLEPSQNIFDEEVVRENVYGISKYKSPALFRMMRLMLENEDRDFIQSAGRTLLSGRALQTVNALHFVDAINSAWIQNGNGIVDEIDEFLKPWVQNNGYPLIHVGLRNNGLLLTQERFGFSTQPFVEFEVPLTHSKSYEPTFDAIRPLERGDIMGSTKVMTMALVEEERHYVLFNVQGQGYYRVNYDNELWERITEALVDPDLRKEIHPLNRATLIDDSLNLARASRIDYDIAFKVVLAMEHETEYAPWRAFVRNMDFLRKRLVALVDDDEDLDPDIYVRMVRRTIITFEREIGFSPDISISEPAMVSLTRGMVMDHACRANYQPCIAAALDWFWDTNNNDIVNPNIPADLRPAVYCTMVREGDGNIISALDALLETNLNMYDRLVILESMACSRDSGFIRTYLLTTLTNEYTPEEGLSIFKAVAASSLQNAQLALNFMRTQTQSIASRYGGNAKLEEALYALGQNMADSGLSDDFNIWVNSQNNGLDNSQNNANQTARMVLEDLAWQNKHLTNVYDWIDENDAPTLIVSSVLILMSTAIALLNY